MTPASGTARHRQPDPAAAPLAAAAAAARAAAGDRPLLELRNAARSFGALPALEDVSLTVARGEAVGVLGPDGAGKSTLSNLIGGELGLSGGSILFDGADLAGTTPSARTRLGIARGGPIPRPFARMTVLENVLIGAVSGHGEVPDAFAFGHEVLYRAGLAGRADAPAGSLAPLDRRRLEVARAMAARPKLVLLDEIAAGLTPGERDGLIGLVREIRADGPSVVWIEQDPGVLVRVADRLVVLARGRLVADGPASDVLADPSVRRLCRFAPAEVVPA